MRLFRHYAVLSVVTGLLLAGCSSPTTPPPSSPIKINSLQDNQEVSSNAPVIGEITTEKPVKKLLYKVNSSAEVDVSSGIQKNGVLQAAVSAQSMVTKFSFSISSEKFNEGQNTITIIIELDDGTRYTLVVKVIFNPDKPPVAGRDVVVLNDVNPWGKFDQATNLLVDPNNTRFVKNLIGFTPPSDSRKTAKVVVFDRGHGSNNCNFACPDSELASLKTLIENEGYTVKYQNSTQGNLAAVAADVKMIFLWLPMQAYSNSEINHLKKFATEGGRIVFVGEWDGFYGAGIGIENDFLKKMGAVMTNKGNKIDCGTNVLPAASIKPHQITTGLTGLSIACSSVLELGPNDFPLFTSKDGTHVLSGVAAIDLTPLPVD